MRGSQIKKKLKSIGVNLTELSSALGYEKSQRLHSALKSDDVKSGLMENIAKIIGKDISWFYDDTPMVDTSLNTETSTILLSRIDQKMDIIISELSQKK